MKLKKKVTAPAPATSAGEGGGGAAIADRFKLDVDPSQLKGNEPAGVSKTGAIFALLGSLIALALLGGVAYMIYTSLELVETA